MRKYLALILALLLLLFGCVSKQDDTTVQDARTIVRAMLAVAVEDHDLLTWNQVLDGPELEDYIKDFYKLDSQAWSDAAVARMEGANAFELAVLFVEDSGAAVDSLQQYLVGRKSSFTGYSPEQEAMVDNGLVLSKGQCVALIVCSNPDETGAAFESCFGDGVNAHGLPLGIEPEPEDFRPDGRMIYNDPQIDDMSVADNTDILAAWESGDDSSLSKQNKEVLDAAKMVLSEWTTPNMSDYEKELGIYAWLTTHVEYDQAFYSRKGAPRTSYEPYGPLINGKGVCLGYATTFQLLMDMEDIKCITVTGASSWNRENHAWNMVKLDGQWYCVDATWDRFGFDGGLQEFLRQNLDNEYEYFNVTSNTMADTNHQWDYDSVPEANTEGHGRP